jgi:hypothetical protein
VFKVYEPSGAELKAFRESIIINGVVCTQEQFAAPVGIKAERQSAYEQEKRGKRMPAHMFTLARITWDALALAEWKKTRPKRDT